MVLPEEIQTSPSAFSIEDFGNINGDHDLISIAENKPPARERKHVEYIILIGKLPIASGNSGRHKHKCFVFLLGTKYSSICRKKRSDLPQALPRMGDSSIFCEEYSLSLQM